MTTKWSEIILLNGSSSTAKSTLSKPFQNEFNHPYLHFGLDDLIFMSPERFWKSAATSQQNKNDPIEQGVKMLETQKTGEPKCTVAVFGSVFRKIIQSMAPVVATLFKSGNSVIFDHVLHDQAMADDCKRCFAGLNVLTIGVFCPLEILEKREQERGDRVIGRARGLFDIVHSFYDYDVNIDTSKMTVAESVNLIRKTIESHSL